MKKSKKIERNALHKLLYEAYQKLLSGDLYIHNVNMSLKFKEENNGLPVAFCIYTKRLPNYYELSKIIDNALVNVKKAYSTDKTLFIMNISIKTRLDTDHIATAETIDLIKIEQ